MKLLEYDVIHKIAVITTDKDEIERLAQFLNGLNNKWTPEAEHEARKMAIELTNYVERIKFYELEQTKDDIKKMQKNI